MNKRVFTLAIDEYDLIHNDKFFARRPAVIPSDSSCEENLENNSHLSIRYRIGRTSATIKASTIVCPSGQLDIEIPLNTSLSSSSIMCPIPLKFNNARNDPLLYLHSFKSRLCCFSRRLVASSLLPFKELDEMRAR